MRNHKSIRVFQNPWLEKLTHVHPLVPLLMWGPVILYLLLKNYSAIKLYEWPLLLIFAFLAWTLIEYAVHRFLFHFESRNKIIQRLVFLFHGIHHDDPNDPTRLVMPPAPAIILSSVFYMLFTILMPIRLTAVFFAFFMCFYLCYDYIHYATHHFTPKTQIGKFLRRYHLEHHFKHEPNRYGVSSPLWDILFRTYPHKR